MTERRDPYTPEQIEQLRAWAALSAGTTGNDPMDSERRKAGDDFANLVASIRDSANPKYTYPELAEPLGMRADTVRGKLARRRKETPYPSMRQYQAKPTPAAKRTATHFSCGCERTRENSYYKPGRNGKVIDYCRRHQLARLHAGRDAKRAQRGQEKT